APERFHKVRVNPRRPKVFKEVRRVKRNPAETDVLLCFDRSGSMEGKKETLAKGIAGAVVLALAAVPQARVRLLAFESSVELVLTGAPLPPERVLALVAGGLRARGGTNLPLAFRQAIRLLEDSTSPRRLALLLTDGDTSGVYSLPDLMELAGARGVDFLCIGIPEADPGKLQQTFGEKALYVADLSSLPEEIARVLPKVV
ncbi:MAG: VWA domain-containing protein, partial [Nitrospinota bacterium]